MSDGPARPPDSKIGINLPENGRKDAEAQLRLVIDKLRTEIEDLERSEQQWRVVFENNPTMYFIVDASGTILAVNPFGAEQLGYAVGELVGQPVLDVFYEPDREAVQREVADCLERVGTSRSWEHRKVRKDGSVIWVRETARAVHRDGDPVVLIACEDITERKHAEERIREQEIELRQVLDLAPEHISVLGPDGNLIYANQAARRYLGPELDVWRAEGPPWAGAGVEDFPFQVIHPDDRESLMSHGHAAFQSGSSLETEARVRRHDGKYRWFLLRLNPIRDAQGHITRWHSMAVDIEDRKRAEERLQDENVALREEIDKTSMFEEIVGSSAPLRSVLLLVAKVAPTDSTVLITGETGTGKELIARAIHRRSRRASRSFLAVNCASIPSTLIAAELFGYEKGAFTGANQRRVGRFELASGGTLFLDEVGEIPMETQVTLLRVLQEHAIERIGGSQSIAVDVRVIAATNRDLWGAVEEGTFRRDLFYRLNVFPIHMPPLRDRSEDIPLLVEYLTNRYARKVGKKIRSVAKSTMALLQEYDWPGNIRELQNVLERGVILCEGDTLTIDETWLISDRPRPAAVRRGLGRPDAAQEKEMIERALAECHGRVAGPDGAAAKLGIPRSTLESRIRSLRINKHQFHST